MKQSLLLLIIAMQALVVSATAPSGIWSGTLDLMGTKIPLVIDFDHSTLKSPLQTDQAIPADIAVNGDTVSINVKMIGLSYYGVISKDTITGNLSQSGMKLPMVFTPGDYVPERPQTPAPPHPYTTVDMSIPIDGGGSCRHINCAHAILHKGCISCAIGDYGERKRATESR